MHRRSRVPVLVTAAVAVLVTFSGGPGDLSLAADEPTTPVTGAPEVIVHEAPEALELRTPGMVKIKAGPPARPGDTVYLNTAGPYNAGYVRVDEAVLDADLAATLRVAGREYLGTFNYWTTVPASTTYPEGTSATFPVAIVSPPAQKDPACGGETPAKPDGSAWDCTYSDEFEGDELDRRYWVPQRTENSGFTTGTRFRYACALDDPATVAVREGNLELSLIDLGATRDCGQNRSSQFAYGQVMHHQTYAQTYGKYEIRAKIPDLQVTGSQVSFWLWPRTLTYGPWPASGEIDIAEMYSSAPGIDKPFLHYLPGQPTGSEHSNVKHAACPIKVGEFNTYGLVWEPGKITILLNGKVCMVNEHSSLVGDSTAPFDHPFYLALNQAMGTIGNDYDADQVPDRLTTQVDYVRVWK